MLAQEEARRLGHNFVGTEQVRDAKYERCVRARYARERGRARRRGGDDVGRVGLGLSARATRGDASEGAIGARIVAYGAVGVMIVQWDACRH